MNRSRVLALSLILCTPVALALLARPAALAAAAADAPTAKQDHAALQGRWERQVAGSDADGRGAARAVKEISGDRETVTYLDDAGQPVYATTADFKLETAGRVKLYTYSNLKVTKGKESGGGESPTNAVSYIYRVEGDLYHEAHGLLVDSPAGSKPAVVTWKRVK